MIVCSLSTDVALVMAKRFLRSMAQPFDEDQAGLSLWALEDIEARQAKEREGVPMDQQKGQPGNDEIFEGLEDQAIVDAMMGTFCLTGHLRLTLGLTAICRS